MILGLYYDGEYPTPRFQNIFARNDAFILETFIHH